MSSHQGSQKLRRNGSPSTSKSIGPLRATIPVSFMSQNLIHAQPESKSVITSSNSLNTAQNSTKVCSSPTSKKNPPSLGRSRHSPWRMKEQWSPTLKVEPQEPFDMYLDSSTIRRTASLDAIYLKGQWPKENYEDSSSVRLLIDKSTQTNEWHDERRYSHRAIEASPSRDRKPKCLFSYQQLNLPSFQYSPGSVSPNRVAVSTNTEWQGQTSEFKETSSLTRAIAVPLRNNPSLRVRNSVEGFNTEIEKLVLSGNELPNPKLIDPTPDGHRAPIAELFKNNSFRTVNTQTPLKSYSANSSSGNSSPCESVSPVVWGVFDHSRPSSRATEEKDYNSLSPEDFQGLSLGTSPRVSRFLCREPPDGCEKVETLKAIEQSVKVGHSLHPYYPPKPNALFVPSSGSAFCPLNRLPSLKCSSSSSHLYSSPLNIHGEASEKPSHNQFQRPMCSPSVQNSEYLE